VLELTRQGEQRVEEGTLDAALRESLGVESNHPVFVPSVVYTRAGKRTAVHLMEGYAFIGTGLPETAYFALEHNCQYVKQVLSTGSDGEMRSLSTLPDANVEEMRKRLRQHVATDIEKGMVVAVTEGTFANLEAEVMDFDGGDAVVSIELRSIKIITRLPRVFLDPSGARGDD
jgi:transcription antitermination factor NusG